MSTPTSTAATSHAVYRQRRWVEALRQQVYAQDNPAESSTLLNELLEAEESLCQLESALGERLPELEEGVLLDSGGRGRKPGGVLMGQETTGVDLKVHLRQSYLPTAILHILNPAEHPLVTFKITYSGGEYVRLRLTSFVEGYSARAIDTVELTSKNNQTELHQLPTFFHQRLKAITEMCRATLHIHVDDLDGKTEQQSTFPIWLMARTSAYLSMRDPSTGERVDLSPYLAAWVTPNSPAVMALIRRAVDLHPEKRLNGYQDDPEGVRAQVKAIYEALKKARIKYVNSVLCPGQQFGDAMQRVRLPREALKNRSANCLDATVLMASALESASLYPGIVLVPGHAFLAWETSKLGGAWDYLETTMMGTYEFEDANRAGRALAENYATAARRKNRPEMFRLLPVFDLRIEKGIYPME
jgi:hypothetical protein